MITQFINWITSNSTDTERHKAEVNALYQKISQLEEENRLLNEQISGKVYDI